MVAPQGEYVRHWIPELKNVPATYVHNPWTMPLDFQQQTGCARPGARVHRQRPDVMILLLWKWKLIGEFRSHSFRLSLRRVLAQLRHRQGLPQAAA